eukprot:9874483-Lingulodinium_polyedra.AAC.1
MPCRTDVLQASVGESLNRTVNPPVSQSVTQSLMQSVDESVFSRPQQINCSQERMVHSFLAAGLLTP